MPDGTIDMKRESENMTEGFDSGMLAGVLANKGVDPGIVALMNDRCKDGNWGDGGFLVLLLLIILLGGRNGFGNYGNGLEGVAGVDRTVVNEANYGQMMDAIRGNRDATERLADTLNCDVNTLQSALCGVDKALAVNRGDITSAIQSCCCNVRTEVMQAQNALQSQIAQCCCNTNLAIERQSNELQKQIQETRFLIQTTDSATRQLINERCCDLKTQIANGFCDLEKRQLQDRIHELEDQRDTLRAEAQTSVLLGSINGTKCVNARYDTTTNTVCGTVGARNCCCNRIPSASTATPDSVTPASDEDAE